MMKSVCIPLVTLLITVRFCGAQEARKAKDSLLEESVAGHLSSISNIRTLYAKVVRKVIPAKDPSRFFIWSSEYWRGPGLVRVREKCEAGSEGQEIEFLQEGGIQRTFFRQPYKENEKIGVALRLYISQQARPEIHTDVWRLALLGVPVYDGDPKQPTPLHEAMKEMTVKNVVAESGLVKITLAKEDNTYEISIDPRANWLIKHVTWYVENPEAKISSRTEYSVSRFMEVQPGVYFPASMKMQDYLHGELSVTNEVEFSDVQVNTLQMPPFPVKLPIIAGMIITDEIKGASYTCDADGNPIGPVLEYRNEANKTNWLNAVKPPEPTANLKRNRNRMWLVMLIGLTVAAFALFFRRRSRRKDLTSGGISTGNAP